LSDEQYKKHQKSLASKLTEKFKNMNHESNRLWSHISSRYYDFLQFESDAKVLIGISKEELLEFFTANILPGASLRRKVSVHIVSKKCNHEYTPEEKKEMESIRSRSEVIEEPQVQEYKSRLNLTNEPKPVQSLSSFLI
jgi:insulysin